MSAYVVFDIEVTDPSVYDDYKKLAPAAIAAHGGRYLARGGRSEVLEGDWSPSRLVILEFDSLDRARAWMDSPEYREAKKLRHASSNARIVAVEGA